MIKRLPFSTKINIGGKLLSRSAFTNLTLPYNLKNIYSAEHIVQCFNNYLGTYCFRAKEKKLLEKILIEFGTFNPW